MINTAVIIASWNGKNYLKDCIDSLSEQTDQDFKIVFIDNGSSDDSVSFLEKNYSAEIFTGRLEIIKLEENTGFAKGYNIGIEKALENEGVRFVLVLNNDTLLGKDFIENMKRCAEKNPEAGSIQPKILNFYSKNRIDCVGIILAGDGTAHNRGYGEIDGGQYDRAEEIFGTNGTAALFLREALEKTRLNDGEFFDNSFFAYYEDVDLAWRMRLAGFRSYFCPDAKLWHVHSATAGKASLFKAYYLHRNYFFTVLKNYPFGIMMATLGRRFLSYLGLVFANSKRKKISEYSEGCGKGRVTLTILKAWASVIYNLPAIVRKRRVVKKNVTNKEIKEWLNSYRATI